jgi:peptide/nickel transport system substrate-binding protein
MARSTLRRTIGAGFAALVLTAAPVGAQEVTLGLATAVTSMDPHFHNLASNINIAMHVFDRLIEQDERQNLRPGLASEWKALNDTTWEFKLRRGVKFHDGSDFDATDVAVSIKRVGWVPNSPSSFTVYTRSIKETIIVDPHTMRFVTHAPAPLLPVDLSSIAIVSRKHAETATGEFNAGRATIGTGPFKFVRYLPGDRVDFERNEGYWGDKPHWRKATVRLISNDAARVAAILAGDVQAIDSVPPTDLAKLRATPSISLTSMPSNSVLFLHVDHHRDQSPFVADKAGAPLAKNPLRDARVRKAMSKAINRQAIVERVMEGAAIPAASLLAPGFFGSSPKLVPDAFDPDGARKLLADAGYPNGFALTIYGPNDRYTNDEKVLQALAPMLSRIGIDTKVVALPWAVFITQAGPPNYAYSSFLIGNSATTGESSFGLRAQFATVNPAAGMGTSNRARYSNPQVDAKLKEALTTVDDAKRRRLLEETEEIAMGEQAIIPILHQVHNYATRKGIAYTARTDSYMVAQMLRPAN